MTKPDVESTPAAITKLVSRFEPQLPTDRVEDIVDWLDHREWGLALDLLADSIFESEIRLDAGELLEFRELLLQMDMPADKYEFLEQG